MKNILVKRLVPEARKPFKAHAGDAGWDIIATSHTINEDGVHIYGTGLAVALPMGMGMDVRSRSSIFKTGLIQVCGIGTIDSGYRGEIKMMFYQASAQGVLRPYKVGDKIGQLIPFPSMTDDVDFVEVNTLPPSWDGREEAGFGSSGK